jgi:hypothetical protein
VTRTTADYDDDGDAADTLRFARLDFDAEAPTDPDATAIYNLHDATTSGLATRRRRRQIRDTRENLLRLQEALAATCPKRSAAGTKGARRTSKHCSIKFSPATRD